MKHHPNFILFNPETIRADAVFGAHEGRAHTPALDKMAAQGHTFSNTFCQSPFCAPSRISLFTGQYPHTGGHRSLTHLLHAHERNLFRDLKDAGYTNVVFGKNDLMAQDARDLAFDEYQSRFEASRSPLKRHRWPVPNGTAHFMMVSAKHPPTIAIGPGSRARCNFSPSHTTPLFACFCLFYLPTRPMWPKNPILACTTARW
jgi:arylsulfatase A-like enzyme